MTYTAPYVMFWMRADPLRWQVGGGGALEIKTFLGPVKMAKWPITYCLLPVAIAYYLPNPARYIPPSACMGPLLYIATTVPTARCSVCMATAYIDGSRSSYHFFIWNSPHSEEKCIN